MGRKVEKFTTEEKQNIIKEYESGLSSGKLAEKYRCNKSTICDILKKNGIKARDGHFKRQYSFNEHYFDKIDSEDKAYFLGLLFADGCNLKERNIVCIELIKTDSAILEKFAEVTGNNRPLYDYNHKNGQTSTKLSFNSKYFCEVLDKLGCVPRKSLVLQFPNYLDESLLRHFLRGYFDGDGSITLYRGKNTINRQASVVSSKYFIDSLKEKISQINSNIHYITRPTGNGSSLVLCRKDSVKEFLSYIYEDCSIYLERKFLRYQELINK